MAWGCLHRGVEWSNVLTRTEHESFGYIKDTWRYFDFVFLPFPVWWVQPVAAVAPAANNPSEAKWPFHFEKTWISCLLRLSCVGDKVVLNWHYCVKQNINCNKNIDSCQNLFNSIKFKPISSSTTHRSTLSICTVIRNPFYFFQIQIFAHFNEVEFCFYANFTWRECLFMRINKRCTI